MPTAPQYLTDQFPSDAEATAYLHLRGFVITPHWEWIAPPNHDFTQLDWDAIDYMIMEWDFGGLHEPR